MASPQALLIQSPICLYNPIFEIYLTPPRSLMQVKHSFPTLDAHWYILKEGLIHHHLWQQYMTEPILLLPPILALLKFWNTITTLQAKSVLLDVIQEHSSAWRILRGTFTHLTMNTNVTVTQNGRVIV
jgi:hypothetical protein